MHLTPEVLEGAYEFLKTTPPFARWKLPAADDVSFTVIGAANIRGTFWEGLPGEHMAIGISGSCLSHTTPMLVTMAHEMCHMKAWMTWRTKTHGAVWRRLANSVCTHHGFDPKEF